MTEGYLNCQLSALGAVLIDPAVAGTVIHRTREEDYTGQYRSIYKAIKSVFLSGRPADITLVAAQLGPEYQKLLLEMVELTPTAANVDAHIDGVLEEALKARVRECAEALQTAVTMDEIHAIWEKMNRSMAARPGVRVVSMDQGLQDFYERQKTTPEILPWGMSGLDNTVLTERGDFTVIGGYASAGKTAFSLQLAWNQAEHLRVGYFSLETKPEKLIDRTVALVTGLDFGKIKRHQLGFDYGETTLKFQYQDDRPSSGEWPLAGEVHTTIKEESYGTAQH